MKRILACGLIVLTPLFAQAQDAQLVNIAVKDLPVENGKVLDMEFHEIERNPESSTVEVVRRSGGSVSSTMFVLRGMCQVTKSRDKQYFIAARIPGDIEGYTVTFPDTEPGPDAGGFSLAKCQLLGF